MSTTKPSFDINSCKISPSIPPTFTSPITAFRSSHPHIQGIIAGAIVLSSTAPLRALLICRAPTDSFPLKWEVPGGSVDETDTSLAHSAVRELFEEAGLVPREVICAVPTPGELQAGQLEEGGMIYTFGDSGSTWGKVTFLVNCEEGPVVLDPEEHVEWAWVSEEELRRGQFEGGRELDMVSEAVTKNVLEALRMRKAGEV